MSAEQGDSGSAAAAASGEGDAAAERAARWSTLPARVRPEEFVEEVPTEPARDPDGGRDPNNDWMLRYGQ